MELNCDKSAIRLINKYKLPVDKKEYCSKANIILYKYLYWGEYGIWPEFTNKKTTKSLGWEDFQTSRLLDQNKYININNIPLKLLNMFNKHL
jgi:hypothetical protein